MSSYSFLENIDVDSAKYLLSISKEDRFDLYSKETEEQDDSLNIKDKEVYDRCLCSWLHRAIKGMEKGGGLTCKYKYSSKMVDCGRMYVKDFGIQRVKGNIRGFLIKHHTKDYDMKNAHPTILLNILKTTFPEKVKDYPMIQKYISNRDYFINECNISKVKILTAMNKNKKELTSNRVFNALDDEFKSIQKLIFYEYHKRVTIPNTLLVRKKNTRYNKEGKYMNWILCIEENKILQEAMDMFKGYVNTPMFDGFTMCKSVNPDDALKKLNQLTEDRGVRWDVKEHNSSICIDEGVVINYDIQYNYDEMKEKFEEKYFKISNPLMFGECDVDDKGNKKVILYPSSTFRIEVKNWKYYFDRKENEFFTKWIEDTNRREYKELRFCPRHIKSDYFYNSFTGFDYEKTDDDIEGETIEIFKNLLKHLCDYDDDAYRYLLNYIAHLIQKPYIRPNIAVVLKSKQGHGKDTLLCIIEKMLGSKYVADTSNTDDIFGNYNEMLKDKIVLKLNEMEGKHGYMHKEKMKDMITAETINFKQKYISTFNIPNYLRLFILSNNLNPVQISDDDRRYFIVKANYKKPSPETFDRLYELIESPEEIQMLVNYLHSLNISCFNPAKDRIKTNAYKNMKEHNEVPLYRFLYDSFIYENVEKQYARGEIFKKDENYYIKTDALFDAYNNSLTLDQQEAFKPNKKIFHSLLTEIDVNKVQIQVRGKRLWYFKISKEHVETRLSNYKDEEDILDIDADGFEEVGVDYSVHE